MILFNKFKITPSILFNILSNINIIGKTKSA